MLSDKELVKRCRRGDERAFAQLVDSYKDMVFTVIDRMIYQKSIIEDLAQEVFIRVYKGLPHFRGKSKLSTWIYRIAYNVCLAEIGSGDNRHHISIMDNERGEALSYRLANAHGNPEEWVEKLELKEAIGRLLNRLQPKYKMVLTLYYLQGLSYTEISEVMRLPMGTVKTYLHRAKKHLRDIIIKEGIR